jgi:RNA polymerase sigma-70 factor (ECF subfamily)
MDDFEAICRLKNGDIGGLEILVTRHQHKAVQTAYLITHDEQLAEDVVQDTFIRIYQRIGRFDESRPFRPYLLRSVVNAALNASEKGRRWIQAGNDANMENAAGLLLLAASTEEEADRAQLKKELSAALKSLPPKQRVAIVQRYYLGMNEKEMAESNSVATGTIKWLLSNARAHLRSLLGVERNLE